MSYPIFWRAILSYSIASNSKTDEPYSGDLAALMWRGACALESTLPQDRMFGLYGVMNKVKIEVPEPDYTRSEVEVCEMTTVAIIRTTNALDILPSCVQLNYSASYPSWVLGSSNTSSDWLSLELITGAAKDKVYGASCGTKATYSLIYGPGRLAVRGLILSKVKFLRVSDVLGTHSTHGVEQELPYWSYIKACQSWCQYVATHFGFEDISHAAIRILTNDHHKMKEIRIHDYDESSGKVEFTSFQGWFDLMLYPYCLIHYPEDLLMMSREESRLQNPGSSDCVVPLLFYAMAKKKRNGPVAEQIAMTILKHANYALMVLESGHFARGLGICKEGDVVALLAASSFPVALRHVQGNESRFVSQIYVDGIMDGEGWPENESELEEIVLV
ncbi:hypothetical protein F5Y16DRAFT_402811 [Xylariaceae sp. FL0255]|nr:hypothetical protein F5Y16DRAFT_402811 [Xylariaceae sp. FL0255]